MIDCNVQQFSSFQCSRDANCKEHAWPRTKFLLILVIDWHHNVQSICCMLLGVRSQISARYCDIHTYYFFFDLSIRHPSDESLDFFLHYSSSSSGHIAAARRPPPCRGVVGSLPYYARGGLILPPPPFPPPPWPWAPPSWLDLAAFIATETLTPPSRNLHRLAGLSKAAGLGAE